MICIAHINENYLASTCYVELNKPPILSNMKCGLSALIHFFLLVSSRKILAYRYSIAKGDLLCHHYSWEIPKSIFPKQDKKL